jgi:RNA 2',3'-cyclic 3'-phosphodiesterase
MTEALGRGFVAVVPPEDVLDTIAARLGPVRDAYDDLRWSRREQWHLTLRFLGAVPDVDELIAALRDTLRPVSPVDALALGGAGAFPNARRASVVWFGVRDGADGLARVAAAVEAACVAAGFTSEPRPFRAHLTVARVRRPRDVGSALAALGEGPVGAPWPVTEVVVVSSETRPTGAVYEEIARIPLGGA